EGANDGVECRNFLRQGDPVSRYRFIEVEKVNHAVRTLCRVLQVSRTAYYQWSLEPLSPALAPTSSSPSASPPSTRAAGRPTALHASMSNCTSAAHGTDANA